MNKIPMRHYLYGSLFLGLGVLVPQIFHMTGIGGAVFLPMHIPVILAGMLVCPMIGLYVGIFAPVISFLLTGMPPVSPPVMKYLYIISFIYDNRENCVRYGRFCFNAVFRF